MSYSITTRLYQTNTNAFFTPVENTVWYFANGGKWSDANGASTITMGGSGTSGIVRLAADNEYFLVALGVHNYKLWTDIVPDLTTAQTGVAVHPQYYTAGTAGTAQREKQLSQYSVKTSKGRTLTVNCAPAGSSGRDFGCNIIIG